MLVALLQRMGCEVTNLGTVPDDPAAIRRALEQGLRLDALFVTGGMSMGAYDYVPRLLVELGVELKITKVRLKPGKPFVFGVRQGREGEAPRARAKPPARGRSPPARGRSPPAPLLRLRPPRQPRQRVRLHAPLGVAPAGPPRRRRSRRAVGHRPAGDGAARQRAARVLPAGFRHIPPGGTSSKSELSQIRPLHWKGSADLFTLARANALLVRGENEPPLPQGTLVRVLEV